MGFLALPFMVVMFWLGLAAIAFQQSQAVTGAGVVGRMDSLAQISAHQAEMFGAACASTAIAQTGVVTASMVVILPPGVVLPAGAMCMTTAGAGNGRNVYGYLPVSAGAVARVMSDTQDNAVWYRVQRAGAAISLVTGETMVVPAGIPAGNLVDWIQTTS